MPSLFRRAISAFAAVSLALATVPAVALGQESSLSSPMPLVSYSEGFAALPQESLLSAYVSQRLAQELPRPHALRPEGVTNRLSGPTRLVYDLLEPLIAQVAAGTRTSTVFSVPTTALVSKTTFTASELGVRSIASGGQISSEAMSAAAALITPDLPALNDTLRANHPAELYWFDVTTGITVSSGGGYTASLDGGVWRLTIPNEVRISFAVAPAYAAARTRGTYTTSVPSSLARVNAAIGRAKGIAASAGGSTLNILTTFLTSICDLVSYNDAAAAADDADYGDPWQLISVFDGDPSTKVVCEGYAKAFQYLCDLSAPLAERGMRCVSVSGTMSGGTGAGRHMWNVVQLPGGKNYLVDVTNCDSGTVGAPDKLFMAVPSSGTPGSGRPGGEYSFAASGNTVRYTYGEDIGAVYRSEDLTLASTPFADDSPPAPDEGDDTPPVAEVSTSTIVYHFNDGTGEHEAHVVSVDAPGTLRSTPFRAGFTFLGWSRLASATTGEYDAGASVGFALTSGGTYDLYAVWEAQEEPPAPKDDGGRGEPEAPDTDSDDPGNPEETNEPAGSDGPGGSEATDTTGDSDEQQEPKPDEEPVAPEDAGEPELPDASADAEPPATPAKPDAPSEGAGPESPANPAEPDAPSAPLELEGQSGWQTIGTSRYYYDPETHEMARGNVSIGGNVYAFDAEGRLITSADDPFGLAPNAPYDQDAWLDLGDGTLTGAHWYVYRNGKLRHDCWVELNGDWYWMGPDGEMFVGWHDLTFFGRTDRYYFNGEHDGSYGKMYKGARFINGGWYYFNVNGEYPAGAMLRNGWKDGAYYGPDGRWAA